MQYGARAVVTRELCACPQVYLKLLATAEVEIRHIHFKYEDSDTSKGNEFVVGFAIDKVSLKAHAVRRVEGWQRLVGVSDDVWLLMSPAGDNRQRRGEWRSR